MHGLLSSMHEEMTMPRNEEDSPRQRALRAARAVTLGMGMALAATGCSESHPADASVPDGGDAEVDCSSDEWRDTEICCEMSGGTWFPGGGCGIPGPFVPPAMA